MGVQARVVIEAPSREIAAEAARAAYARIEEIEQVASDYRDGSEVMRLCRAEPGVWHSVSPDLGRLLAAARDVSAATAGVFDVTVGPAVALWRDARRTGAMPAAAALVGARDLVDLRRVEVAADGRSVRLTKSGVRIDLGGIAKGYAAHEAVKAIAAGGKGRPALPKCLVALAGDVYAGQAPSGEAGWRVQLRGERSDRVLGTLIVENQAVSTSGDTEQFVEIDGTRYSHIVDPRTGLGVVGGSTVSAVGEDGARVDAMATAAVVLGAGRMEMCASDGRVTLIVHDGGMSTILGEARRVRLVPVER